MKKKAKTKSGKKAAKPAARRKLKMKDLTAGRKKGSVRGGMTTATSTTPTKVQNLDFRKIVPCV
jgi:hypothetical protein